MDSKITGHFLIVFGLVTIVFEIFVFVDTNWNLKILITETPADLANFYLGIISTGVTSFIGILLGIVIKND